MGGGFIGPFRQCFPAFAIESPCTSFPPPPSPPRALFHAAVVSMGTEISEEDVLNISALCDQVIELSEYRAQLYDYLKSRMMAIAPNLTVLVGEGGCGGRGKWGCVHVCFVWGDGGRRGGVILSE